MRKVTASAVILTAITGCSQSEVASSNWSFDAPTNQQLAGQQGKDEAGQANFFASDSQGLLNQSSRPIMGPDFGKLDEAAALSSDALADSASLLPTSGLQAKDALPDISPDISAVVSTRVDPLASVRSYLEATSSVSGISNRVPYSSQVYLPDAPVYSPTVVSAEAIAAWPPAQSSFSSDASVDAAAAVADLTQGFPTPYATQSQPDIVVSTVPLSPSVLPVAAVPVAAVPVAAVPVADIQSDAFLDTSVSSTPQAFISTDTISAAEEDISESYLSESYIEESQLTQLSTFQDDLPVLEPAQPERSRSASTTSPNSTVSVSSPSADAPVSVGTAILQTLAQNGDAEALETLAAADAERGSVEISVEPSVETSTDEVLGSSLSGASTAEARPTLSGLLGSMPQREGTPLVTSFEAIPRDSQRISRLSGEAFRTGASAEAVLVEDIAVPGDRSIPAFRPQALEMPLPAGLLRGLPAETAVEAVSAESASLELEVVKSEMTEAELLESEMTEPEMAEPEMTELEMTGPALVDPISIESLRSESISSVEGPLADAVEYIRPNGYSSPLLEGLAVAEQSTEALPAVYVPIPETPATDVTASFIREAIASLGSEVNRADAVVNDQDLEDSTATLVRFSEPSRSIGMAVGDSAAQKYAHLRKLPSLAANRGQSIRRRQRIVWQ